MIFLLFLYFFYTNKGTGIPSLGAFDIGDNSLLGARINLTDNEGW